jgi:hypothetical protein
MTIPDIRLLETFPFASSAKDVQCQVEVIEIEHRCSVRVRVFDLLSGQDLSDSYSIGPADLPALLQAMKQAKAFIQRAFDSSPDRP